MAASLAVGGLVGLGAAPAHAGLAAVPRPDHVVVVLEENHSYTDIIGNPNAPYLNQLAGRGALMTSSYSLGPASQPNYLALMSGSTHGVTDQTCPLRFTSSLSGQLARAGLGFTGYAESLPSVGYTGCASGRYVRRHNPWVNFTDVPASANRPFSTFPSDYNQLPAVTFVQANLDNDMHDGSIAQGDTWLRSRLGAYADWADTHNSLLVVTFDEDSGHSGGHVTTILTGQQVRPGRYDDPVTPYTILRTIEDAYGLPPLGAAADAEPLLDVWTAAAEPVAAFTPTCTGLSCSFDPSASTGTITGYRWDFGDGTGSTDPAPVHTYAAGGPTRVRLTVIGDAGATGVATQQLQLIDPSAFAADAFDRTVTDGMGTADAGGAWTSAGSPDSAFAVTPGLASLTAATVSDAPSAYLADVVRSDTDLRLSAGLSRVPAGGIVTVAITGRRVTATNAYAAKLLFKPDHSVTLRLVRIVNGTESVLLDRGRVVGLDSAAGPFDLRVQVTGTAPTTVRAKVWAPSTGEPAAWSASKTDSTAGLQTAGAVGFGMSLASGVTSRPIAAQFGPLSGARSGNSAPVAAFSPSCTERSCTFDASASRDADGSIVSWDWTFGDGGTASGAIVQHDFTDPGTYPVTLVVTDDEAATGTTTRSLALEDVYAQDAFARAVTNGWGSADVGGAWSVTGTSSAFSVASGAGRLALRTAPTSLGACLCSLAQTDADVVATMALSAVPTAGAVYLEIEGRRVATRTGYAVKLVAYPDRSLTLRLVRVEAGTETIIAAPVRVPGVSLAAGRAFTVRIQVTGTGPTTVQARAWPAGGTEPAGWLLSAADTTASLQSPGAVGVLAVLPSGTKPLPLTVSVSAFRATVTR